MAENDVLESAQFIASVSTNVCINQKAVDETALKLLPQLQHSSEEDGDDGGGEGEGVTNSPSFEPPNLSPNETLEWIFLLDTLNFCFWSDSDVLHTTEYCGVQWTGYRALCAALVRAVEEGIPVHKPSFYGKITDRELRSIFRSETEVQLPMIEKRRENLHEAAKVLNEIFEGDVSRLVEESDNSAQQLVSLLVEHFPSYRDVAFYKGRKVFFLKRAQIFVADVWQRFSGEGYGEFHDINTLTMFADYRVPQSLQYLHVLEYSDGLTEDLKARTHLEAGGEREAEIRGCSIWAVELIRRKLSELNTNGKRGVVHSVSIDFFLWNYAKTHSSKMHHYHPIHRTQTIFY